MVAAHRGLHRVERMVTLHRDLASEGNKARLLVHKGWQPARSVHTQTDPLPTVAAWYWPRAAAEVPSGPSEVLLVLQVLECRPSWRQDGPSHPCGVDHAPRQTLPVFL